MSKQRALQLLGFALGLFLIAGCDNQNSDLWDGSQSAGRFRKSNRDFWGHEGDLKQSFSDDQLTEVAKEEFIPLSEDDLQASFVETAVAQSAEMPGEDGSSLPSLDHFRAPLAALQNLFQNLYFYTDEYTLKGDEQLQAITKIAQHLKEHPELYVTVSGHCDERGPQAYNFSLGAKRANFVRTALVKEGVNPNQIFTISYGKEQPVIAGHAPQDWAKNRRAEFKLFDKKSGL